MEDTADRLDRGLGDNGAMNTEGAIAKYMATEAGNAAADAAIQAHGGYGYTRPYVVEKIRRDVRITTIYEGTSEIMEMTIARDRWQTHLKSRGRHYVDVAGEMTALHARNPRVGADAAALAAQSLAVVLDCCQAGRLTRNQHVLFRIGELVAATETAVVFAREADKAMAGARFEKSPTRFDGDALAAMSRVFARGGRAAGRPRRLPLGGRRAGTGQPGAHPARRHPGRRHPGRTGRPRRGHGPRRGRALRPHPGSDRRLTPTAPDPTRDSDTIMEHHDIHPVAVVGMSAIMPDAPNADAFWDNVSGGQVLHHADAVRTAGTRRSTTARTAAPPTRPTA